MAANPRTVAVETWFTWDGVSQRLPKGQAIDVTPGSALERAIGAERLVPLGPTSALPPVEEAPAEKPAAAEKLQEPAPAPVKAAAPPAKQAAATDGKSSTDGKDGGS